MGEPIGRWLSAAAAIAALSSISAQAGDFDARRPRRLLNKRPKAPRPFKGSKAAKKASRRKKS